MRITLKLLLLCLVCSARAEDIYFAQTAAGADDGTSASNAKAISWINTAGNWGSGANKVSAGDTIHACGTLTTNLTIHASGTAGNPITLTFEAGAKFSNASWTNNIISKGSGIDKVADFIIDGGSNGKIEATDNGYLKAFTNSFYAISLTCASNVTIRNLSILDMFPRTSNTVDCGSSASAIYLNGALTNVTVNNCVISNNANSITFGLAGGFTTNCQIYSNVIRRASVGVYIIQIATGSMQQGTRIWANDINNGRDWDGCPGPFHQDGIHAGIAQSGSTNIDMQIYRNKVGDQCGYSSTSAIFVENTQAGLRNVDLKIFNNLITLTNGENWANGWIATYSDSALIANNTIIAANAGTIFAANANATNSFGTFYTNNLVHDGGTFLYQQLDFGSGGGRPGYIGGSDYNVAVSVANPWNPGSYTWANYADHATYPYFVGFDPNSTNISALTLASDYGPATGDTVLVSRGKNLSGYFTTDFYGNARPASAAWTVGAIEYVAPPAGVANQPIGSSVRVFRNVRLGGFPVLTPHNHPSSTLLFETFEGTGYATAGWTAVTGGGGTVNPDFTSTVLDGSQSLEINGPTDEVAYITNSFTAQSEVFAYFKFRITSMPATESAYLSLFRFRDVDGATVFKMQIDSSAFLRITTGGTAASALASISAGTTYYCWLSWDKDNGANSVATMAISTTPVQPTIGDWFVTATGTQVANNASQVFIGYANDGADDSGPEMTFLADYVLVDDVAIQDYP